MAKPKKSKAKAKTKAKKSKKTVTSVPGYDLPGRGQVDYEPPLRGEHIRFSSGEGWDAKKRHRAKMKKAGPGWLEKESDDREHRTATGRRVGTPGREYPSMERYGGKGWTKAKKNPGKVVRHPESRRGSKD